MTTILTAVLISFLIISILIVIYDCKAVCKAVYDINKTSVKNSKRPRSFVCYITSSNDVGNASLCFRHNPPTTKDIYDAEKEIEEKMGIKAVIINWKLLSD